MKEAVTTISRAEWIAEATRRFGNDPMDWRFVCPVCKHEAAARDWHAARAPEGAIAFSCVGRWTGAGTGFGKQGASKPCNYTGGGLFRLNPVRVVHEGIEHQVFAFADAAPPKGE